MDTLVAIGDLDFVNDVAAVSHMHQQRQHTTSQLIEMSGKRHCQSARHNQVMRTNNIKDDRIKLEDKNLEDLDLLSTWQCKCKGWRSRQGRPS